MSGGEQVVVIAAAASSFTVTCDQCTGLDAAEGSTGSTFAGRLDLDLRCGVFLCRRGHTVRVERAAQGAVDDASAAA